MYDVDAHDRVVELTGVPQSSIGAPCPLLLTDEHRAILAYAVERTAEPEEFSALPNPNSSPKYLPVAIVTFHRCYARMLGPPNDEAFSGHPLSSRGLDAYGTFEVEKSSWIRRLEEMNQVHPQHTLARFALMRHLIFTFHDSTFECICRGFEFEVFQGPVDQLVLMTERLDRRAG
jgi:hypothetical protein